MERSILSAFSLAGGSALGRAHGRSGRNNQDAFSRSCDGDSVVAAVADGCSQGRASEVGARLAVTWIAANAGALARTTTDAEALAAALGDGLRSALADVLMHLAPAVDDRAAVVGDLLLFTLLVAVVTPERAYVLGLGDGLYAVNGRVTALDAGPENAPPYLGYALLAEGDIRRRDGALRVLASLPTGEVDTIVLATDGAAAFDEDALLGEADDRPPRFADVAFDTRYATNGSLLQKKLHALAASDRRLQDDVTVVVIRRRAS